MYNEVWVKIHAFLIYSNKSSQSELSIIMNKSQSHCGISAFSALTLALYPFFRYYFPAGIISSQYPSGSAMK